MNLENIIKMRLEPTFPFNPFLGLSLVPVLVFQDDLQGDPIVSFLSSLLLLLGVLKVEFFPESVFFLHFPAHEPPFVAHSAYYYN